MAAVSTAATVTTTTAPTAPTAPTRHKTPFTGLKQLIDKHLTNVVDDVHKFSNLLHRIFSDDGVRNYLLVTKVGNDDVEELLNDCGRISYLKGIKAATLKSVLSKFWPTVHISARFRRLNPYAITRPTPAAAAPAASATTSPAATATTGTTSNNAGRVSGHANAHVTTVLRGGGSNVGGGHGVTPDKRPNTTSTTSATSSTVHNASAARLSTKRKSTTKSVVSESSDDSDSDCIPLSDSVKKSKRTPSATPLGTSTQQATVVQGDRKFSDHVLLRPDGSVDSTRWERECIGPLCWNASTRRGTRKICNFDNFARCEWTRGYETKCKLCRLHVRGRKTSTASIESRATKKTTHHAVPYTTQTTTPTTVQTLETTLPNVQPTVVTPIEKAVVQTGTLATNVEARSIASEAQVVAAPKLSAAQKWTEDNKARLEAKRKGSKDVLQASAGHVLPFNATATESKSAESTVSAKDVPVVAANQSLVPRVINVSVAQSEPATTTLTTPLAIDVSHRDVPLVGQMPYLVTETLTPSVSTPSVLNAFVAPPIPMPLPPPPPPQHTSIVNGQAPLALRNDSPMIVPSALPKPFVVVAPAPVRSVVSPTPAPVRNVVSPTPAPVCSVISPTPAPVRSAVSPTPAPVRNVVSPTPAQLHAAHESGEDIDANIYRVPLPEPSTGMTLCQVPPNERSAATMATTTSATTTASFSGAVRSVVYRDEAVPASQSDPSESIIDDAVLEWETIKARLVEERKLFDERAQSLEREAHLLEKQKAQKKLLTTLLTNRENNLAQHAKRGTELQRILTERRSLEDDLLRLVQQLSTPTDVLAPPLASPHSGSF